MRKSVRSCRRAMTSTGAIRCARKTRRYLVIQRGFKPENIVRYC